MLPETFLIHKKYSYNLYVLSDERLIFFRKNGDEIDVDTFFNYYNWILYKFCELKPIYKNFKSARSRMIKKFNYGKYHLLLKLIFCYDIRTFIISFIGNK